MIWINFEALKNPYKEGLHDFSRLMNSFEDIQAQKVSSTLLMILFPICRFRFVVGEK